MSKTGNHSSIYIAPSLLAADPAKYQEEIKSVEAAGADWLHIDVMDGSFVPQITFGTNIVAMSKKSSNLYRDVHLMIREPERHLEAFAQSGAQRIIIHQEVASHLHRNLQTIKSLGASPAVAVNPGTPVQTIFDVLDICDLVLVMTVNPGWGGQAFIESALDKIKSLRAEIDRRGLKTIIEVDGGINAETAVRCRNAGAQALVAGSSVFGASDRKAAVQSLRA